MISAPAAVVGGRVYFACEDGYLYALGPDGKAAPPAKDLELWKVRSPLTGPKTDAWYDRFTSFANWANTNADNQGLKLKITRAYFSSLRYLVISRDQLRDGEAHLYVGTSSWVLFHRRDRKLAAPAGMVPQTRA